MSSSRTRRLCLEGLGQAQPEKKKKCKLKFWLYCTAVSRSSLVFRPAQCGGNTCSEMAAMFRGRPCEWKVFSLCIEVYIGSVFL